jgi:hypothetical protein
MTTYFYTEYFEAKVLAKRPYLRKEWCDKSLKTRFVPSPRNTTGTGSGPLLRVWTGVT